MWKRRGLDILPVTESSQSVIIKTNNGWMESGQSQHFYIPFNFERQRYPKAEPRAFV